jgi:VWFA-related protein
MKLNLLPSRKGGRPAALAAGLALLLCFAGSPGAQTKTDPQKPLQYEVSVTVKLVQVYVSGKDGQPVSDLAAEEFEVTDNGQPVTVSHFEKHFLGQAGEAEGGPATGPMNRKFFLVFDFGFNDPHGALKAKNAGLHFIDNQLQPGDEAGLLSFSAYRGLVLHEYLTSDHARIRKLVDSFGLKRLVGRAENLTDFIYSNDIADLPALPAAGPGVSGPEDFFARQARLQTGMAVDAGALQDYVDRTRFFIESMDNFARVLRNVPGYKNILFFSAGVARQVLYGKKGGAVLKEWSTPEELAANMSAYDAAQANSGLRGEYTSMLQQFKAANAPVFAMDVSRTQKETDVTYEDGTGAAARELEGADSLRQMASNTGGKFYANTVDYKKAMDSIQNVTGAYYVLGYSVSEKWDGKFHKIKVRVKRKGVDVNAQGGYFSPKPFSEYTSFEKLLHMTDLALSDVPQFQVPADVPVAAMAVTVRGWPQLAVFTRASKTVHADVLGKKSEAYLLLIDEAGEVSLIKKSKLRLPDETSDTQTLYPSFFLNVKPGRYSCRMVLRNMDTGAAARGSAAVVIPGTPAAPVILDPPLLLVLDPKAQELAASEAGKLGALFGYDAGSFAPLSGVAPAGSNKLYAALRCSTNIPGADFEISATLAEEAAPEPAVVPVTIMKKSQDGPTVLLMTELGTGELRPGRYSLKVDAKEKGSGLAASSAVEFIVK